MKLQIKLEDFEGRNYPELLKDPFVTVSVVKNTLIQVTDVVVYLLNKNNPLDYTIANVGDWIIKDENGELRVVKNADFQPTQ